MVDRLVGFPGQSWQEIEALPQLPSFAPPMNASHSAAVKVSAGPVRSFESRTWIVRSTCRTSTHEPPSGPDLLLLPHRRDHRKYCSIGTVFR